jgi:hypothetical protein
MDEEIELQIVIAGGAETPLDDMLVALTKAIDDRDPDLVAHGCLGGSHGYGARYENDVFAMRPFYWGDCDCGADEREEEWSKTHRHSDTCYSTDVDRLKLNDSEARRAVDAAVQRRERFRWHAPNYDRAQKEVERLSKLEDRWRDAQLRGLCRKHNIPWNGGAGCMVHCNCGYDAAFQAWVKDNGHRDTCALVLPNFRHKASGFEVRWYKYIGRGMETSGPVPADLTPMFRECLDSLPPLHLPHEG